MLEKVIGNDNQLFFYSPAMLHTINLFKHLTFLPVVEFLQFPDHSKIWIPIQMNMSGSSGKL